jgi:hypothetical protein
VRKWSWYIVNVLSQNLSVLSGLHHENLNQGSWPLDGESKSVISVYEARTLRCSLDHENKIFEAEYVFSCPMLSCNIAHRTFDTSAITLTSK